MLFAGAEAVNFVHDRGQQVAGRKRAMAAQHGGEPLFTEFLAGVVERFADAVGIESQNVTGRNSSFTNLAVPVFERAYDRSRGLEPFERIVAMKHKSRQMAAVGEAQAARGVVVLCEKQSGERAISGVLAKKLVHGTQHPLWLVRSDGALAAKIRLEISHQKRRGDSFSGNVANDKAQPLTT